MNSVEGLKPPGSGFPGFHIRPGIAKSGADGLRLREGDETGLRNGTRKGDMESSNETVPSPRLCDQPVPHCPRRSGTWN